MIYLSGVPMSAQKELSSDTAEILFPLFIAFSKDSTMEKTREVGKKSLIEGDRRCNPHNVKALFIDGSPPRKRVIVLFSTSRVLGPADLVTHDTTNGFRANACLRSCGETSNMMSELTSQKGELPKNHSACFKAPPVPNGSGSKEKQRRTGEEDNRLARCL